MPAPCRFDVYQCCLYAHPRSGFVGIKRSVDPMRPIASRWRKMEMGKRQPGAESEVKYLFGDSHTAARRLDVLARTFEPSTRSFLEETGTQEPNLALDLGCGPGHTTQLVSTVLRSLQTVGIDSSEQFLAAARGQYGHGISFLRHDVTSVPFPVDSASVIYARFLATHLDKPASVIHQWATQLVTGGLLLLDEVEFIHTSHPLFVRYLRWVDDLLRQQGQTLYIGPSLAETMVPGLMERLRNRVRRFPVADRDAATLFLLNVDAWADHPYVVSTHGAGAVARMSQELREVVMQSGSDSNIEWGMRQIAFVRV